MVNSGDPIRDHVPISAVLREALTGRCSALVALMAGDYSPASEQRRVYDLAWEAAGMLRRYAGSSLCEDARPRYWLTHGHSSDAGSSGSPANADQGVTRAEGLLAGMLFPHHQAEARAVLIADDKALRAEFARQAQAEGHAA